MVRVTPAPLPTHTGRDGRDHYTYVKPLADDGRSKSSLESSGSAHFSVTWVNPKTSKRQRAAIELNAISADVKAATEGLKLPSRIFASGLSRAVRAHLAEWAETRVGRGLERVYSRGVSYLHNRSEVPHFVAATLVSVFDRIWAEVQEPVTEYMRDEFGKAIGTIGFANAAAAPNAPGGGGGGGGGGGSIGGAESDSPPLSLAARCTAALRHACGRLRVFWVRTLYPYDLSYWGTLRNRAYWGFFTLSVVRRQGLDSDATPLHASQAIAAACLASHSCCMPRKP